VGLFRNQPADKVLARADVVLTIGYDPVEYDASFCVDARAHTVSGTAPRSSNSG
jgi:hypothetical protein